MVQESLSHDNTVAAASLTVSAFLSGPPQPSQLLCSLRGAMDHFENKTVLVNGRPTRASNVAGMASGDVLVLSDLPPVMADTQLRWALTLLRDFSVQMLLRKQFAMRIREIVLSSGDTSGITQSMADAAHTLGHFANKCILPHADKLCRQLFQLCQMSLTYTDAVDRLDEHVLRVYIPLLIYYVLKPSEEAAVPAAAAASEKVNLLAVTARAVVKAVFEHPLSAQDDISRRQEYSTDTTCFSDKAVLKEFLESIAKHMINMKLKG